MDWLLAFFSQYGVPLGGAAAALAIIETVFKPFRKLFGGTPTVRLDEDTKAALAPSQAADGPALTVPEFIRLRRELKADLEEELAAAQDAEKDQLRARIAELENQINHPEEGLAELQKRNAELEALLERSGNEIGGDRLAEARVALEKGDYSIADDLFAEIEERRKLEIQEAARAAFGRGEIAEAEVRWADAAEHYARASKLDDSLEALERASALSRLSGNFEQALRFSGELLHIARSRAVQELISLAINEHALNLKQLDRLQEAEPLYREALEIGSKTIGVEHPDYATRLNNLAGLLEDTRRFDEAEMLYREALEIGRKTIGVEHPNYAIRLNNLAGLLQTTGLYDKAEALYREAMAIHEKALGPEHPNTVTTRDNLNDFLANKPD